MAESRHFSLQATPEGYLEVDGDLTSKEVEALREAWIASHGGEFSVEALIRKQRKVIFTLQARLILDTDTRSSSARGSGEVKDMSLALAAAVDKLYVLMDLPA